MPEQGSNSTSAWIIVTLVAALIGSPILLRVVDPESAKPNQQPVIITLPGEGSREAPEPALTTPRVDKGYMPGPSVVIPPENPSPPPSIRTLDPRSRLLTAADLFGLSQWDLDLLRNEIYARHGRRFRRDDLQRHFNQQPWYKPVYPYDGFPDYLLSEVERRNAEFIATFQGLR